MNLSSFTCICTVVNVLTVWVRCGLFYRDISLHQDLSTKDSISPLPQGSVQGSAPRTAPSPAAAWCLIIIIIIIIIIWSSVLTDQIMMWLSINRFQMCLLKRARALNRLHLRMWPTRVTTSWTPLWWKLLGSLNLTENMTSHGGILPANI